MTDPQATFSPCFGGPFLTLPPRDYATLLKKKMEEHNTGVYLINTGWSGGSAASGAQRMPLASTRAMVTSILTGSIEASRFTAEPVFGLSVPTSIEGVDPAILMPREAWSDGEAYDRTAAELTDKFRRNFRKYAVEKPDLEMAGPSVTDAKQITSVWNN